jgi:hypothetical protein
VNESCRSGPIAARLLTGHPKAIVVPWYGSLEGDSALFSLEAGDGVPHYTEPNCDLWQDLPDYVEPINYRMAVPVWVISAPNYEAFRRGQGEVVLCGHLHPLHNGALVDYFQAGVFQYRHYFWDSEISPMAMMRINLGTRLGELERAGAWLGPVPLLTPPWQPRLGTAAH